MDNGLENKNEYIKFEKTSSFELQCNSEKRIFDDLNYKLEYMKKNHPELNVIAIFLQGSQNYGLDDEKSGQEFMNILGKYKKDIFKRNFRLVQSIKGTFYAEKEQIYKRRPGNEEMFDKYGCDVKSLSHMYRMMYLLGGIREGKNIDELFMISENFKGKNFRKELMDVKRGKNTETALKFVDEAAHLMEVMYQDVKLAYENDNPNCATFPKLGDIDSSVFENLRKDINDFVKQTVINNIKKNKEESRC